MINKKWPLHPQPDNNQLLKDWIKDLSKIYEVNYKKFCTDALKLMLWEIDVLDSFLPKRALVILSSGTGASIDDLRERTLHGILDKLVREAKYDEDQYLTDDALIEYIASIKKDLDYMEPNKKT